MLFHGLCVSFLADLEVPVLLSEVDDGAFKNRYFVPEVYLLVVQFFYLHATVDARRQYLQLVLQVFLQVLILAVVYQ